MEKSAAATNDISTAVAGGVDSATTNVHKVIDKVSDAARPAVDRFAKGAHQAVDKFAGAATHAAEAFEEKSGKLKEVQSRLSESCGAYVREKPLKSLGIAVAAGFLLSWLFKSR